MFICFLILLKVLNWTILTSHKTNNRYNKAHCLFSLLVLIQQRTSILVNLFMSCHNLQQACIFQSHTKTMLQKLSLRMVPCPQSNIFFSYTCNSFSSYCKLQQINWTTTTIQNLLFSSSYCSPNHYNKIARFNSCPRNSL